MIKMYYYLYKLFWIVRNGFYMKSLAFKTLSFMWDGKKGECMKMKKKINKKDFSVIKS